MGHQVNSEPLATYNTNVASADSFTSRNHVFHSDQDVIDRALELVEARMYREAVVSDPQAVEDYLALKLGNLAHEVFGVIHLDCRNRVICFEEMFRGSVAGAAVYPREVAKHALAHNAVSVILVHNHPSGVGEPSKADRDITRRLKDALKLFDIRVLDHLIVAGSSTVSFAQQNLL